eukprot:TRINITY_DN75793_c0_g1_i1.p1 TRINITY_DN75793_c0_g1~~TRINITY_DN75793_c0_g1_i1.p1  ORF type:complete len:307 (+),score=49.96 TRINITY_DN75793_c0_g1_i1:65-922(+)
MMPRDRCSRHLLRGERNAARACSRAVTSRALQLLSAAVALTLAAQHAFVGSYGSRRRLPLQRDARSRGVNMASGPPASEPSEAVLIARAKEFLDTATGFYSPLREDMMSKDFIFRGGVVGPLNKDDYIGTMERLGVYKAFNLTANAFGFTIDPKTPLTVRFFLRNRGEHVAGWQPWGAMPPIPLQPKAGQSSVLGPTETGYLTFEPGTLQVRFFTTGNVIGKYEDVNTGGFGAVLGLFHSIGYGWIGNLAMNGNFRNLANVMHETVDNSVPRTKSDNVPAWWTHG